MHRTGQDAERHPPRSPRTLRRFAGAAEGDGDHPEGRGGRRAASEHDRARSLFRELRQGSARRGEHVCVNSAREVGEGGSMPVMVVGGFRSAPAMIESLDKGELDLVGIARPTRAAPGGPKRLLSREIERLPSFEKTLDIFHLMPWNYMQLERMGDG